MVKLADRIHNMRTLNYLVDPERRQRHCAAKPSRFTRPSRTAWEWARCAASLEDWPSSTWSRTLTIEIAGALETRAHANEEFLGEVRRTVEAELRAKPIPARLERRVKRPYSGVPEDAAAAEDPFSTRSTT